MDTTIFLATDLPSYTKMISLWVFFVFVTTYIGFTQREKNFVKVIDDDISHRIIEFKAKNEIVKMSRNYSNIDKKYAELKTFMSIMLMTKRILDR